MPVSIFTQKEFLIESKLNGFFGEISSAVTPSSWSLLTGGLYLFFKHYSIFIIASVLNMYFGFNGLLIQTLFLH